MAYKKETTPIDSTPFILPLSPETLKQMFDVYCDETGYKNFVIKSKHNPELTMKITGEMMFKFKNKVWTPDWFQNEKGSPKYSFYYGDDHGDYQKTDYYWNQFTTYANKRLYAKQREFEQYATIEENTNVPE